MSNETERSYLDGAKKLVPITYYGGKATHLDFILPLLKPNKKFIEPFMGSMVVALNHRRSEIEIVNDIDGRICNFFQVLRDNILKEEFLDKLSLTVYSKESFEKAKIVSTDPVEEARRFYILANQSYMSAQKSWQYTPNVVRNSMSQAISRWLGRFPMIERTAHRVKMMTIENMDGVHLIEKSACKDTTVFIDPPYPKEIRTTKDVYLYEMTDEEHIILLKTVKESPADIVISSYENSLYDKHLRDWFKILDKKKMLAGHSSDRQETIYMNYDPSTVKTTNQSALTDHFKVYQNE